jgi:hypothetical protein
MAVFSLCLIITALVGIGDYWMGTELTSSIFYVISISIFVLEILLLAFSRKTELKQLPALLFGASSESNTSNRHLQELGRFANTELDILILESPIKRFENRLSDTVKARMHWCRSVQTDLKALIAFLGMSARIFSAVSRASIHRKIGARRLSMTFVRLLRGLSISQFLKSRGVQRLVFTLSGNACTAMIELGMKGSAETIHWLHGVGLGFKFDSFSDKTLVNNEFDYRFYGKGLSAEAVFFPDKSQHFLVPAGESGIASVVVYSNLIHPSNSFYRSMGTDVENELLSIIANQFPGKELVLKPHPSAFRLLGDQLDEYRRSVEQRNFRFWQESDRFAPERTLFVSTVSTIFIDLVADGKCVFMYDKYADGSSRFQRGISEKIRFQDEDSLRKAIQLLDSPTSLISALQSLGVQSEEETFSYLLKGGL